MLLLVLTVAEQVTGIETRRRRQTWRRALSLSLSLALWFP